MMEKYILDGQYKQYLEMIGIDVGEALRSAGVPEDLFSREGIVLPQFLVETEIVFSINIIRKATKYDVTPLRIEMMEPVTDESFLAFVRCDIEKGAENKVIFRRNDMERPFVSHNETMWAFFEPELRRRLSEMEKDDTMAAKVRSALTELLPGGVGTI